MTAAGTLKSFARFIDRESAPLSREEALTPSHCVEPVPYCSSSIGMSTRSSERGKSAAGNSGKGTDSRAAREGKFPEHSGRETKNLGTCEISLFFKGQAKGDRAPFPRLMTSRKRSESGFDSARISAR